MAKAKPVAEYIKREDAKTAIRKCTHDLRLRVSVNSIINSLPSIEQKTGEWLSHDRYRYRCSSCGILAVSECLAWNYCTNCGADMKGNGR